MSSSSLLEPSSFKFTSIPDSNATASLAVYKCGEAEVDASMLVDGMSGPQVLPAMGFVIKRNGMEEAVVFDLGIKISVQDYAPALINRMFNVIKPRPAHKSMAQQLEEGGFDMDSVKAVVYSHSHFDHVGDLSHFPSSTRLIVGPGTLEVSRPGYPEDPDSAFLTSDIPSDGSRVVQELQQEDFALDIGTFKGMDFWGDGSFYLLDAPGHLPGHLIALVRTSASPSEFVLLCGDAAHNRLLFTSCLSPGCHPHVGTFRVPFGAPPGEGTEASMHVDLEKAYETMARISRMDMEENIWAFGAHDTFAASVIEKHGWWGPEVLNSWKARGCKQEVDSLSLQSRSA